MYGVCPEGGETDSQLVLITRINQKQTITQFSEYCLLHHTLSIYFFCYFFCFFNYYIIILY